MRALLPLLLVTGCAASTNGTETAQEGLARELAGRVAGESRSCVPAIQGEGLRVVDAGTITYRQGNAIWVNRLETECPGLRPSATLIVELRGGQYCRGERIRGLEVGSSIPGPTCLLNQWTPYRRAS